MGMYICCECDNYGDSDDGCFECQIHTKTFGLICTGCTDEMDEEKFTFMTGEKP